MHSSTQTLWTVITQRVGNYPAGRQGDGGWETKEIDRKIFRYPKKIQPMPDGSNASGWYGWLRGLISLLSVFNSVQLSQQSFHVWHFLTRIDPSSDNRGLLATPKEIYDLNLSAVTLSTWSFQTPTSIFRTKELYNPVFFCSACILSGPAAINWVGNGPGQFFGINAINSVLTTHSSSS